MSGLEAFILGLIQGLAEFLPISSSGHLVIGKEILGERKMWMQVVCSGTYHHYSA